MRGSAVPGGRRRPESGSATVTALVLAAVLLTVSLAGTVVGAVVLGHRHAAAAADLAALAAARSVSSPLPVGGDPCLVAGAIARANDARLTGCRTTGREVTVAVEVTVGGPLGRSWAVPGRSRAGPSEPGGPSP